MPHTPSRRIVLALLGLGVAATLGACTSPPDFVRQDHTPAWVTAAGQFAEGSGNADPSATGPAARRAQERDRAAEARSREEAPPTVIAELPAPARYAAPLPTRVASPARPVGRSFDGVTPF